MEFDFKSENRCPVPIPGISAAYISTWRDKKICIKRYSNTLQETEEGEFLPLFKLVNDTLNEPEYKLCGQIKTFYKRVNETINKLKKVILINQIIFSLSDSNNQRSSSSKNNNVQNRQIKCTK